MTKSKYGIVIISLLLAITIALTILKNPKGPGLNDSGTSSFIPTPSISLKVFKIDTGKWAYEVFIDSCLFIYRDKIPGIGDSLPIVSQADAIKCGELILKKIKSENTPSITVEEIDSMGIICKIP